MEPTTRGVAATWRRCQFAVLLVSVFLFSLLTTAQSETLLDDVSQIPIVPEHSFESPFLYGTSVIPNWDYGASAVASEDMIRLVPAIRSRTGWMWNQVPVQMNNWQVDFDFKIHNTRSPGADGMAFWYTYERAQAGGLYGNIDTFNGIGIVFDTYDNDGMRDNPRVILISNQGKSQLWDIDHDLQANQIASCISYFRNTKNNVKARIRYERSTITVEIDTDGTGDSFQSCFQAQNIAIKTGGYFGLTAATGGLADFHDVFNFVVRNLDEKAGNAPATATATATTATATATGTATGTPDLSDGIAARRRRGLFDPFRDLNHVPTPPLEQPPAVGNPTPDKKPDENPGQETTEQMITRFREQIEKLREEKQKEQQAPAPTTTTTAAAPGENPPAQQAPASASPSQPTPPSTATTTTTAPPASSSQQSQDEFYAIVLTAFKNVLDEVKRSDSSIQQISNKVSDMSSKQQEMQGSINVMKQELSRQIGQVTENSKSNSDKLQVQVQTLSTKVEDMRSQLDALAKVTGYTSQSWKDSANELSRKISREAGWGFWTYFTFFICIVLVVAIIWWRTSPAREKNLRYLS